MPPSAAGVRFTGAASGRFYGLSLDHFATYLVAGDALLSVSGAKTGSGVHLYQLSAEHLPTDYQIQVSDSNDVHLHAFKFESAGFLAHPSGDNLHESDPQATCGREEDPGAPTCDPAYRQGGV